VRGQTRQNDAGFTMVELLIIAMIAIAVSAVAAPSFRAFRESMRARNAARLVERELQTARLKAVSVSRSLRVRFNCPAAGQLRILELTGVATTDEAANRCDPAAFPYPGPNDALRSTPSLDSPVIYLPDSTTVTGTVLFFEFDPRGQVYSVSTSGDVQPLAATTTLTVTRKGYSNTVTVNALGRIRLN
jgi:Tfp pilus assembly protein FimT